MPANPLALPPGANGTYSAIVTSLLHPHLAVDVIESIKMFEFLPTHLGCLLKRTTVETPNGGFLLTSGPNGEMLLVPAPVVAGATSLLCDVPDVLAFAEAWAIFMSVLQNEVIILPIAQALSHHLANIIALARLFSWSDVLNYYVAFMNLRKNDPYFNPIRWLNNDPHIHLQFLLTPCLATSPTSIPPVRQTPYHPGGGRPSPMSYTYTAQQPCYAYNGAECIQGKACLRKHVCQRCAREHRLPDCSVGSAPPTQPPQ